MPLILNKLNKKCIRLVSFYWQFYIWNLANNYSIETNIYLQFGVSEVGDFNTVVFWVRIMCDLTDRYQLRRNSVSLFYNSEYFSKTPVTFKLLTDLILPSRLLLYTPYYTPFYTKIHKSLSALKGHRLLILFHTRFSFNSLICIGSLKMYKPWLWPYKAKTPSCKQWCAINALFNIILLIAVKPLNNA
jgi:hypothetical protein